MALFRPVQPGPVERGELQHYPERIRLIEIGRPDVENLLARNSTPAAPDSSEPPMNWHLFWEARRGVKASSGN